MLFKLDVLMNTFLDMDQCYGGLAYPKNMFQYVKKQLTKLPITNSGVNNS